MLHAPDFREDPPHLQDAAQTAGVGRGLASYRGFGSEPSSRRGRGERSLHRRFIFLPLASGLGGLFGRLHRLGLVVAVKGPPPRWEELVALQAGLLGEEDVGLG